MESPSEFIDVFYTCVRAVVTFALMCVPGAAAGYSGFFSQEVVSVLAKFNLNVTVPCLILSNVGSKLELEQLAYLWPLLAWSSAQVILGLLVASLLFRAVGACLTCCGEQRNSLSQKLVRVLPVVATVQNSVGFPLAVMQTVCKGAGTDLGNCFDNAVLYMFVYNIMWQVFVWTVVYALLQTVAQGPAHDVSALKSPLNTPGSISRQTTSTELLAIEGVIGGQVVEDNPTSTARDLWWACLGKVELIVNPALCALAAAVAVAASPTLQTALFQDSENPLSTIGDALTRFGAITPVLGVMLLSASLGRAMKARQAPGDGSDDMHQMKSVNSGVMVPWWAACVVIAVRLLLVPGLGLCGMKMLSRIPDGNPLPLNKTMRVLVMLELASPSATNSIVLCQRLGMGDLAESLATMYLPMYVVSLVTVPVWLSAALT